MSARDWQPGDEALLRVKVSHPSAHGADHVWIEAENTVGGLRWVPAADLLPVPQADEDTIERARKVVADKVWEIHGPDSTDMDSAEMDAEDIVDALAAANLLADPRTAEERFLGATYVEDLSPTHGGLDETVEVIQPGRSEAQIKAEALREHRLEWASWIEDHGTYVGTVPMTQAEIVEALRSEVVPFGWAARVAGTADTEGGE